MGSSDSRIGEVDPMTDPIPPDEKSRTLRAFGQALHLAELGGASDVEAIRALLEETPASEEVVILLACFLGRRVSQDAEQQGISLNEALNEYGAGAMRRLSE